MRIIKLGLISVVVFSVLLTMISLLIPSHVRISRAIDVEGSREKIHARIAALDTWHQWNEMASDSISILPVSADSSSIGTSWKYRNDTVMSAFTLEESSGITVVQWYFDFNLKWYPWEKFGSIVLDKQFGIPMERSLNNLKKLVENSP